MAGQPLVENYPLVVGGVDDYPVKVGSMLLTMVDPVRGFEREYNRWYERDHFYGGCMIGPWLYAGSRWVAPRELKDLRWPDRRQRRRARRRRQLRGDLLDRDGPAPAAHRLGDHAGLRPLRQRPRFPQAQPRAHDLVRSPRRGVPRCRSGARSISRSITSTTASSPCGWTRRPAMRVQLHTDLASAHMPKALAGSTIEIASSWTPSAGENEPKETPMPLGSKAGGPERLCQLFFQHGDVRENVSRMHDYTNAIES